MEANLNQFRLFTVAGEERANNDRRRSGGNKDPVAAGFRSRASSRGQDGGRLEDRHSLEQLPYVDDPILPPANTPPLSSSPPSTASMNPPPKAVSSTLGSFTCAPSQGAMSPPVSGGGAPPHAAPRPGGVSPESQRSVAGDSRRDSLSSGCSRHDDDRSSRGASHGHHGGEAGHAARLATALRHARDGEEGDSPEAAERSLISTLRSLERAINNHCYLLNKKLRREKALKSTTERTAEPALPKTSAIRQDKVEKLLILQAYPVL